MSEEQKQRKHIGVGYAGRVAKAAFVGIAALTAGVSADAHVGKALVNPDGGNATERHEKGFSHLSNQTNLERSFRNVMPEAFSHPKGPTVEQLWPKLYEEMVKSSGEQGDASKNSLQGEIQGRHDGEASSEQQNQKESKVKKNLSLNERQIATLKAVIEKASKDPEFAARVSRKLAESQQQKEPERRKLAVPPAPCLQDGIPPSDVKGLLGSVGEGGTGLTVNYDLTTINRCLDPITNVQFRATKIYSCPCSCGDEQTSETKIRIFDGIPSTIHPPIVSSATGTEVITCPLTNSNGETTTTTPTSLTVTIQPQGVRNSGETLGALIGPFRII